MSESKRKTSFVTLAAAALCAAPLSSARAQGGSVLELLETQGELAVGAEVSGALSTADPRSETDSYLEAWVLEGRAGDAVTVDLVSDDFDAFLYIVGPGLGRTLSDDDSGGGCHSRVSFSFLESGDYRVIASSALPGETGTYVLKASDSPGPVAAYSCGSIDPAILARLPTGGRTLDVGDVRSGALTLNSPTLIDDVRAEAWTLEGRAGESAVVVLQSDAFDPYLYLTGPGLTDVMTDDDGAGDLDALIQVRFPSDGAYTVVASALSGSGVGGYTIRVEEPPDLGALETGGRVAEVGGRMTGQLTTADPVVIDGRRMQAWQLMGRAGATFTIDLISNEFDAYLYFAGPGLAEPLEDDDGGGNLNSRLTVTTPEDGAYRVIVSAISAGETGRYELRVTSGGR